MSTAGDGRFWVSECTACHAMFRDGAETAGVCPRCGHENHYGDDGGEGT